MAALLKELSQVVGRTTVELDARSAMGRTQETNVGNFIADAFRTATGADVGLMNGGSIRADEIIRAGPLTKRDVLSILPFKNKVVKVEIERRHLCAKCWSTAWPAARKMPNRAVFRRYLVLSSRLMRRRPAGSRIVDLSVNGKPLDEKKKYTLATSDYLAIDGGDGYAMLKAMRVLDSAGAGAV